MPKEEKAEWNVRVQLGAWVGTVKVKAPTAQEAHRIAYTAVLNAADKQKP